jgi:hypothetical protein
MFFNGLFKASKSLRNVICSFRDLANGYELSCLNDLVKTSIEVNGSSIKIAFKGFVFVPEHASGSEMIVFNVVYDLSEKGKKLYFDSPLGDPCETNSDEAINVFPRSLMTRSSYLPASYNYLISFLITSGRGLSVEALLDKSPGAYLSNLSSANFRVFIVHKLTLADKYHTPQNSFYLTLNNVYA